MVHREKPRNPAQLVKGWIERLNGLMVDVYRDRQANGAIFNNIFREEMIKRYAKQNDNTNPA